MKSLYEAILDTDKQIIEKSRREADAIANINSYIDYVVKEIGRYVDKHALTENLYQFVMDQKAQNKIEKMRDKKFKGFTVDNNGPTNFYVTLKGEDIWFEWNYFDNGEDGWFLAVGPVSEEPQNELQKYAEEQLSKKLK